MEEQAGSWALLNAPPKAVSVRYGIVYTHGDNQVCSCFDDRLWRRTVLFHSPKGMRPRHHPLVSGHSHIRCRGYCLSFIRQPLVTSMGAVWSAEYPQPLPRVVGGGSHNEYGSEGPVVCRTCVNLLEDPTLIAERTDDDCILEHFKQFIDFWRELDRHPIISRDDVVDVMFDILVHLDYGLEDMDDSTSNELFADIEGCLVLTWCKFRFKYRGYCGDPYADHPLTQKEDSWVEGPGGSFNPYDSDSDSGGKDVLR